MQAKKASRAFLNITDSKAMAWLTDTEKAQLLAPFFGGAVTVSEAAAQLGLNLNQTYKLVKRLEKMGLLELESVQPRKGRALRYYRTTADEFFIPPSAMSLEEMLAQLGYKLELKVARNLIETLVQSSEEEPGLRIFLAPSNRVSALGARIPGENWQPPKDISPSSSMWHRVWLDFEDARELRDELDALSEKYRARRGKQAYILRLAVVPGTF